MNGVTSLDTALRRAGRRLVARYPRLETPLVHARDRYARAYVAARTAANHVRYAAPPDPYRLVRVDPARIVHTDPLPGPRFKDAGAVTGGDWDRNRPRFDDMAVYRAYEAHFEHGVPWRETEFYEHTVATIASGTPKWGCRSQAEFDDRCVRLDELYESIRTNGYRTQDELLDANHDDPIKTQHRLKTERLKDEIAVTIGRDGEVFFADGRNRLSIAKLLDLDAVPVRVLRRHRGWQAIRDAYRTAAPLPDDLETRPGLAHL